jgi:hypothetical protein
MRSFFLILILILGSLSSSYLVEAKIRSNPTTKIQLMRLVGEYDSMGRSQEPYEVYQDGRYLETGVTDEDGKVFTNKRHLRTDEEFTIRWLGGAEDVVLVNNNGDKKYTRTHSYTEYDSIQSRACHFYDCSGTGFLWIEQYGQDRNDSSLSFSGELWQIQYKANTYTWVSDNGLSYISTIEKPVWSSLSMIFTLCDGTRYDIQLGQDDGDTRITLLEMWTPLSPLGAHKESRTNSEIISWIMGPPISESDGISDSVQ